MIKLDEKTNTWTAAYSKRHPVTRKPKSLRRKGIKTKAEAQRVYNDLVVRVEAALKEQEKGAITYSNLLLKFYDHLESQDLATATVENYRTCLDAHTLPKWGSKSIGDVTGDDVRSLIRDDLASRSKSHQKSMLKFVRGVFTYAVEAGYLASSPVPRMKFRLEKKLKTVLNESQASLLLSRARGYDEEWFAVWATALYTGMRNGELYALTWKNVDPERRLIYVRQTWTKGDGIKDLTKSGEDRVVEIAAPLEIIFETLKEKNPESTFVLPRIPDWGVGRQAEVLRAFLAALQLPSIPFHGLRATWATLMLSKGVEMVKVMKMGGWKNLKTLNDHYLRLSGVDIRGASDALNFEV